MKDDRKNEVDLILHSNSFGWLNKGSISEGERQ